MNRNWTSLIASAFGLLTFIGFILATIAAYITHVVWTVTSAMNEQLDTAGEWFLALAGLFVPPIGFVHGLVIWFM